MAKKVYDLVVKTGTYEDHEGSEKGRYKTVGAVMQNDDGGKFIMLDRIFNPAGVPNPNDRDTVILSMFEPRERDGSGGGEAPAKKATGKGSGGGARKGKGAADGDDEIPF